LQRAYKFSRSFNTACSSSSVFHTSDVSGLSITRFVMAS
jgi:hypothetical protein